MPDWNKIKAEYISGGISTRKLAEKYGVSYGAVRFRCEKENWVAAQRKKTARTAQFMVEQSAKITAKRSIDIVDIADDLIKKLSSSVKDIDPDDYERMTQAANILFKLRETKKGLTAADVREQEARIAKLQKEAEKTEETNEVSVSFEGCDPGWQK